MKKKYNLIHKIGAYFTILFACATLSSVAQVDVSASAATPTATYTTLKEAFDAINAGTHQGNITIGISASTTETASAVLNSSDAAPASYLSVLVRPTNDGITISGATAAGRGVIELKGADNVTIDGDNPNTGGANRNLTITNTAANTVAYTSVVRVANATNVTSSNNINIVNCNIIGSAIGRNASGLTSTTGSENTTFGIYVGGNGGASATDAPTALTSVTTNNAPTGTTINNFNVANNSVISVARAIYFNAAAASCADNVVINNNLIGDQSTPTGTPPYTSISNSVYTKGIYVAGANAVNISNNTMKNILSFVSTLMTAIELNSAIGSSVTISNNNIEGVVNNNTANSSNAIGIQVSSASSSYTIESNTIKNVQIVGTGFTPKPIGIALTAATATSGFVSRNNISYIHNLMTGTGGAYGMNLTGGNNIVFANNFIYNINQDITGGTSFGITFGIYGLRITGGIGHKIYHNTISLNGAFLGTSSNANLSSALLINAAARTGLDIRNNLLSNTMSGGGTQIACTPLFLPSAATSAMNLIINNNALYTGTVTGVHGVAQIGTTYTYPAAGNVGLYDVTNFNSTATSPATNLRAYSSSLNAAGTNDNSSFAFSTAAPFLSSTDLHINIGTTPTQLESNGAPTAQTSVTVDIDGQVRPGPAGSVNGGATLPDIGADEFDGVPLDVTPPTITFNPLAGTCSTTGSVLTATITDVNGVPTSGAGLPVLYWAINSGTYTPVTATSIGPNQYTFNFGTGVTQGDLVRYYIVAQDNAPTPNVGSNASAGASGYTINPPFAATSPTAPASYLIQSPLTGTFSVGAAGTYTSLTQAVNVYNNSCLAGPVVFELTDANYSTNETFPIVINHNPDASLVNNLTIRPAAANSATVSGNALNIIKFNGAKFITIDGSNNGSNSRNLTINTTNTSSAVVVWIGNSSPTQPANSITVKNSTIFGNAGTTTIGNILIGSGVVLGGASEIPNNNITIENNRMFGAQNCIFASGNATTPDQNWNFNKNTIGNSNDLFKSIRGILVQNAQNVNINENDINGGYNAGTGRVTGITSGLNTSNVTISKNKITDIKNANAGGWGANGIQLSPNLANANITVSNNFISDIAGLGFTDVGPDDNGYGLIILSGGGIKVYNNTISIYNQGADGLPSALNIASTTTVVGGIDLRNNILNVTQNVAVDAYAIYCAANANVFSNIDHNNYSSTTANLAFIGSNRAALTDIVAGFGGNANSTTVTPTFASASFPYDLHLPLTTANAGLLDRATVLAAVSDDIDNQARGTTPDMGADEFGDLPATPPTPTQSTVTPTCANGTTLSVAGTPPANVTWYWQGTNASGTSTLSPTSSNLVVNLNGTYYVRAYDAVLMAWSINSSSIAVSNIPVAPTPPTPVVLNNPACFSTEVSVPNPIGTLVYYWQGTNASGTSTTQVATTPFTVTTSGTYYVAAYNTANQCWSTTNGVAVTINTYLPSSPTVTPGSINVCTGAGSALLNANAPASSNTITIPFISSTYNLAGSASNTIAATIAGIPNGATITSSNLVFNGVTTLGLTWLNDITLQLSGASTVPSNLLGPGNPATNGGPYSFNASNTTNGVATLSLTNAYTDGINFNAINLVIGYTLPASTVQWYSAASSGTLEGTGSPFNAVGTTVLPNTSSAGSYTLFAASESGGCVNPTRTPAVVNVTSVLADITPVNASCNGYADGSFTLGTITCGTQPFEYSVNGSAFSGTIPTNLTAGTYTVIIKDATPNQSAPILVTISQPTTTISSPIAGVTPTVCLGDLNAIVTATSTINAFSSYTTTINLATNVTLAPGTSTVINAMTSLPVGATVTATSLVFNDFTGLIDTWGIDVEASLSGAISMPPAVIPALTATNATLTIAAPLLNNNGGNVSLVLEDTYAGGGGSTTSSIDLVVTYNLPDAATLTWWNTSTSGTQIGSNSPFDAVGTSVLPNTNTPGTYTLYAQGEFGGCNSVNRTPVTVVVNPLPTVSVSASSSVICSGSPATLTAGGTATSFTWSPAGGNASTAVVNPTVQTTYTLVGSALGCSANATTTINVNALPTVNAFATSTAAICAGTPETLTAAGSATNFTWTPSGITSGNAVVSPTVTTTYTLTGNDGVCSNTANVTVTVTPLPTLTVTASNTLICSGTNSNATLTASGTSSTYTWSPIANNTATAVVTPTANTTYTVIGEALGCTNTRTIEIAVSSAPSLSVVALGGANICTGNTGTLSAAGSATSFTWSPVGGNGSTAVITPTASTETYTVTGEANGCTSQASITVTVNAIPTVTATAVNGTICNGENSVLTANTSATTFSWSSGANTASVSVTPSTTTVYTVTVTENGCSESTTVTVNVNACTGIEEQLAKDINLYPNPTTGLLNIVIPEEMVSKSIIEMYDGLGKLVAREELTKTTTKVYMNKLEEGMYFYKITSDTKEMRVGKVIKH
jgi:hypothetical protein